MPNVTPQWRAALVLATSAATGAFGASPVAAQAAKVSSPGAVWLRVVDAEQEPLVGAEIVFPTLGVTMAVPEGGALLLTDVSPGVYLVQARKVGYAPAWRTLRVGTDTIAAQLALGPLGQSLDAVTVLATSAVESRLVDFERRRQHNAFGRFVTREEIDRRRPHDVSTILRWVPGVQVTTGMMSAPQITSRRVGGQRCSGMLVFLDGVNVSGRPDLQGNVVLGATPPPSNRGTAGGTSRATTVVVPNGGNSGSADPTRGSPTSSGTSAGTGGGAAPTGGSGTSGGTSAPVGGSGTPPTAGGNVGATGRRAFGEPDWSALAGASGVGAAAAFDVNTIPPSLIAGMEVYTTVAGVPAEYAGFIGSQCGVILLWTAAR